MKNNHVAVGKDMLELDFLLGHSLRGEHLHESFYALPAVSDRRIVPYETLAEEFIDRSAVEITKRSLIRRCNQLPIGLFFAHVDSYC